MSIIEYAIDVKTVSEANRKRGEHWAVKRKRVKAQREIARLQTLGTRGLRGFSNKRCQITLTRIGGRKLDSDNLASSMKAVRDGIADALGVDDGVGWIKWEYDQRPDNKAARSVLVSIAVATGG